jgi:hypothetical protein
LCSSTLQQEHQQHTSKHQHYQQHHGLHHPSPRCAARINRSTSGTPASINIISSSNISNMSHLVVQQHATARLQLRLVNKRQDAHVVLWANRAADNGVAAGQASRRQQ